MHAQLIGHWREEHAGKTLDTLEPIGAIPAWEFIFRADGTADLRYGDSPWFSEDDTGRDAPFPITWTLPGDHAVSIWTPVAPNPEGGNPAWSREALRFEVLAATADTLTLTEQPYGGDFIAVFRRIAAP